MPAKPATPPRVRHCRTCGWKRLDGSRISADPAPPPTPPDPVSHPAHYTAHPSGVECIQVTEHMSFCAGNAVKYLWRAGLKGDALEDLRKARWYVDREIERLGKQKPAQPAGGK